ncbi:hypothetical protein LSUE1_G000381 [Lachnellula suecica]|uniref:Uncharacterized protein n=1 Tax=Lachnellula suecica TaxID=602035 RepID=A0A8T9CSH0_9HELO|nr:hypothetical protein LSUE1_G000381 [Lachnellula suecica]
MSSKIPKPVLAALAQKVRESPEKLRNLTFADTTTSLTAIKTEDLRFDVHRNTQNPSMATGIIQANSEAKNKAVKGFIKGSSSGHKGTHQIIGDKIRFVLGTNLDVEAVASAIEKGGVDDGGAMAESSSGEASAQSGWTWSTEHGRYYRVKSDGKYEWSPATEAASGGVSDGEWTWSPEHRRYYRRKADGTNEWS